jgi:lysophospholipase L1-like esterase
MSEPVYVALGDSITYGEGLPDRTTQAYPYLVSPSAINLGFSGGTAAFQPISLLPQVPENATFITIFFGTNDIGVCGMTPDHFALSLQVLIAMVQRRAPDARLALINIPHYQETVFESVPDYNARIARLGFEVVDLYNSAAYTADVATRHSWHPSAAGHAEIARLVKQFY